MNINRSKPLYLDEWVRARNMMNKHFRAGGPCEICGRGSCSTVWYSIKTGRVRCFKCFDAEQLHWERDRFSRLPKASEG
jgi:hypothetical protein